MVSGFFGGAQWDLLVLAFVLGLAVGAGVAYGLLRDGRRAARLEAELEQARADLDAYRGQVGEHFVRTSELVRDLTRSYRVVYEHLANGAHVLCGGLEVPRLRLDEEGFARVGVDREDRESSPPPDRSGEQTDARAGAREVR